MEIRWKKWSLTLTGLLAYALLLEFLGFILCTLIFMIFLLAFVERQRWIIILLVTVLTAAASYVVFELCLKAQLPKGFLGI
jgi:putative tricarboxylic transport membrane protein